MNCRIESMRLSQVVVAMEIAGLTECYTILHSPRVPTPRGDWSAFSVLVSGLDS